MLHKLYLLKCTEGDYIDEMVLFLALFSALWDRRQAKRKGPVCPYFG